MLEAYIELYYAVRVLHLSLCPRLRFVKNKWQVIYFIWLLFDKALTGTKPYVLRMHGVVGDIMAWYEWRWLGRHLKGHGALNMMGTIPLTSFSHHFVSSSFHSNLYSQFQVSKSRSFALSRMCLHLICRRLSQLLRDGDLSNVYLFSSSIHWILWHNSPRRTQTTSLFHVSRSHTVKHKYTPVGLLRTGDRPLHDNIQQSEETDIFALSVLRTRDPSSREPADLRLRLHGHQDHNFL